MYGSKIDNLLQLKNNKFNIPNFIVIKFEDAFQNRCDIASIINANKETNSNELSKILKQTIAENIEKNFQINLKCEKYAVRSSSNIEDGEKDSFAGQFQTFLNVPKEELNIKIIECFKSLADEDVIDYLRKKRIDLKKLIMNVCVQEMVQADYSGVIFTANPQGLLNESVIVVGKGLGESVVLDKVDTTTYYYNLTDKEFYYEGSKGYLGKDIIDNLISESQKIEELIGPYLDIEFGIVNGTIYILQARKITTIDSTNPLILDNSNIVESYPGVSSPLTISFVEEAYSGIFRSVSRRILKNEKELNKYSDVFKNMVGSSNGRLYYKISNWYTIISFLPFNKMIIPIWQEMMGVKNKFYNNAKINLSIFTRIKTYFNSLYELCMVPKNMDKLNKKFIEINNKYSNKLSKQLSEKQAFDIYKKLKEDILSCWDITLLNDIYAFVFTGMLKSRLKNKYRNYKERSNKYISKISNIESLKPIKELINLAYIKSTLSDEEYEKKFEEYIQKYGDRNVEELKLESLTFRTNPQLLNDRINEYRNDMDKLKENYENVNKNSDASIPEEDCVTKYLIEKCMLGIKNREISRLNRSRIYGLIRGLFLRIGQIYYEKGIFDESRDVFYLQLEEIEKLIQESFDVREIIAKRKEEYLIYNELPSYTRLVFMKKEFNKHHKNINTQKFYSNQQILNGVPCSNGVVTGAVLVVNDVHKANNVKNKILVTRTTDPGWVFILATAKGVISEKGSLLSHTAIISRELNIPSIVGVSGLLNTIRTDDVIEMNGTTGEIKIIKKA